MSKMHSRSGRRARVARARARPLAPTHPPFLSRLADGFGGMVARQPHGNARRLFLCLRTAARRITTVPAKPVSACELL